MTDGPVAVGIRWPPAADARPAVARRVDGERLALVTAAVAVVMLPFVVPKGPANVAPADAFILVALAAAFLWATTAGSAWRFPYGIAATVFIAGGALGALTGPVPGTGLIAVVQDVALLAWCWALVNIAQSARKLQILLAAWVYSAMGWALLMLVGVFTGSAALSGQIERQGQRAQLTLADPSYAANYFFVSMMLIWATGRPRHRAIRLTAYAILVSAIAVTGSNSGMVSLLVGVAVAAVFGAYRRFGAVPAVTALSFIIVAGFLGATAINLGSIQARAHESRYAFIRDGIGRGTSIESRQTLLQETIYLYRSGTPLGEGPVSTKPRLQSEQAPLAKEAHDDYLAALTERGIVGFLGVFLLMGGLVLRTLWVARAKLANGLERIALKPNALVGAVAGTMVAQTVYEFLHVRHVWTLFAIVAALSIWGRNDEPREAP